MSCAVLPATERLSWNNKKLTTDDMATLAMILRTNGLPRLHQLSLYGNGLGDAGVRTLCEGLGRGLASIRFLVLGGNGFGPAGAEAIVAALRRGVMPELEQLHITGNQIGNQSTAALAAPLRKLPALNTLSSNACAVDDEGVASLVGSLGKDDFKALKRITLGNNHITDTGMATLAEALDAGWLPNLQANAFFISGNPASAHAAQAVQAALAKRFALGED